jgi:hypothetical protein
VSGSENLSARTVAECGGDRIVRRRPEPIRVGQIEKTLLEQRVGMDGT